MIKDRNHTIDKKLILTVVNITIPSKVVTISHHRGLLTSLNCSGVQIAAIC